MKTGAIAAIIVVILGVGGFALTAHKSPADKTANSSTNESALSSTADNSTANSGGSTSGSSADPTATSFTINANDEMADLETLNVKRGDKISVTFKVDTSEVYHGGLEFRSDVVSSKPIQPGDSDTVTFTASKSFDFTPYWYQSNIQKDYLIHVNVE